VPLSEEELRLLEQMERALVEEDPKFANTLRGTALRRAGRRRVVLAGVAFAAGITVLMTGAVLSITAVGVVGFVIMLASAYIGLTAMRGPAPTVPATPGPILVESQGLSLVQGGRAPKRPKRQRQQSSGTFMQRMEERWRRRREGGY